jgi:hypothetical protein
LSYVMDWIQDLYNGFIDQVCVAAQIIWITSVIDSDDVCHCVLKAFS